MMRYDFLACLPKDREILRQTQVTFDANEPPNKKGWYIVRLEYPGMEVNESRWPGYSEMYWTRNYDRAWKARERFERWLNQAKREAGVLTTKEGGKC
jgi:hypothetical protein